MIREYDLRVLPQVASSEENIIQYIAKDKGLDARTVKQVRVLRRGIDARGRTIYVNLKVRAYINEFA
ncbi:MAG: FAD-binding protein, partial [Prevotella sp.]